MNRNFNFLFLFFSTACATLPSASFEKYEFPKGEAFVTTLPTRKFERVGQVRSQKVQYSTIGIEEDEENNTLCKNYFNKAVKQLVEYAKKKGADAVIEVKSVTQLMDGKIELHASPECYEDGVAEGQVITVGVAIKYIKEKEKE